MAAFRLPRLPVFAPGTVWLVGAGPGDPGLLSLLALHGLRHADDVVYDALIDRRILALARRGATLHYAGKRGGKPSPRQPDISRKLVELAQKKRRVLRLKGGDPFVFGRGGEEALALEAARVRYRIVPGITAGIGGLAYAGIPLTHRDVNSAVTFVTGHASGGDLPDGLDWRALAQGAPILVVYMALKHLDAIARRLIEAGRPLDDPVAIIASATTPRQRVLETTLAHAARAVARARLKPPAVLAIGRTLRLKPSR
ncbi:MAG: uroporphyrinogen-III C-methyltransferase [Alphaproteobacteria bacterium]|nr:uroporphyrinogen-III C-methyltransferase [Alphaproteobacteria bacterium]